MLFVLWEKYLKFKYCKVSLAGVILMLTENLTRYQKETFKVNGTRYLKYLDKCSNYEMPKNRPVGDYLQGNHLLRRPLSSPGGLLVFLVQQDEWKSTHAVHVGQKYSAPSRNTVPPHSNVISFSTPSP